MGNIRRTENYKPRNVHLPSQKTVGIPIKLNVDISWTNERPLATVCLLWRYCSCIHHQQHAICCSFIISNRSKRASAIVPALECAVAQELTSTIVQVLARATVQALSCTTAQGLACAIKQVLSCAGIQGLACAIVHCTLSCTTVQALSCATVQAARCGFLIARARVLSQCSYCGISYGRSNSAGVPPTVQIRLSQPWQHAITIWFCRLVFHILSSSWMLSEYINFHSH